MAFYCKYIWRKDLNQMELALTQANFQDPFQIVT